MKLEFIFIKRKNHLCQNRNQFESLFMSSRKILFSGKTLYVDQKEIEYELNFNGIEETKEDMFHLMLKTDKGTEEEQITILESAEEAFNSINEQLNVFQINTIWDDVSMYYGRKLYPQIIEVESLLRKIIYMFMLKNSGSKWLNKKSPEAFRKDIEQTAKKNNVELNEWNTDALAYANFNALGSFFFKKYSIHSDLQRLVEKLPKLKQSSDEEIQDLVEQFQSKSNWDRYFSDKINVKDLSDKWNKLYAHRNEVAHAKKITRKEYKDALGIIEELKEAFTKCLESLQDIKMTPEQAKAVEDVAEQTIVPKIEYIITAKNEADHGINLVTEAWNSEGILSNIVIEHKTPNRNSEIARRFYEKLLCAFYPDEENSDSIKLEEKNNGDQVIDKHDEELAELMKNNKNLEPKSENPIDEEKRE